MTEERKYAILFSATILAARKLAEIGDKPCPACECAISDAISNAELILRRIDERRPADVRESKRRSGNPEGVSPDSRGGCRTRFWKGT